MRGFGYVCAFAILGGLVGCEDEAETPTAAVAEEQLEKALEEVEQARAEVREAREAIGASDVDACGILTEAQVRSALELPADTAIEQVPTSGHSPWPLCTYRWPNQDYDPQAHARQMMEKMRRRMRKANDIAEGIQDGLASSRASFEVSYTHGPSYEDEEAASRAFASHMAAAERGASRTIDQGPQKGQVVTVRFDMEPVEGLASEARWNERWTQLSVRDGTRIFHVRAAIDQEAEANLEHAKKIARAVMED